MATIFPTRTAGQIIAAAHMNAVQVAVNGVEAHVDGVALVASTPYVATLAAPVLLVDASGASITVNLPAAAGGGRFVVKKKDSSAYTVTIDADGAETIDGALTQVLAFQYDSLTLVSDGSDWWLI